MRMTIVISERMWTDMAAATAAEAVVIIHSNCKGCPCTFRPFGSGQREAWD